MLSEKTKINLENFVQFCILYDGKLKAMNELKNNIEVFKTNYEIMQLHDVDISQTYKSNIRQIVDGEIQSINKIELDKLFIQDKMQSAIMGWDEWLKKNFTNLNMIRNKYAG
jgi:hypothetical protein